MNFVDDNTLQRQKVGYSCVVLLSIKHDYSLSQNIFYIRSCKHDLYFSTIDGLLWEEERREWVLNADLLASFIFKHFFVHWLSISLLLCLVDLELWTGSESRLPSLSSLVLG